MGAPLDYEGPPSLVQTEDGLGHFVMESWRDGNGVRLARTTAYWEKLIEVCGGRDVLVTYKGNQHHTYFLFAPEPPFDFFDELTPELLDGARLIPGRLIEAFFEPTIAELRTLVSRLLAAGCQSVRIVGAPPPKADLEVFVEFMRTTGLAKEYLQREKIDVKRVKVSSPVLLLKLWRIVQRVTAGVVTDARVVFVAPPSEAVDSRGFLARQYYDYSLYGVTHGNNEFGRLMIKQALQAL
jgi:hypothetical protein